MKNSHNSIIFSAFGSLALAAMLVLVAACSDDFDFRNNVGQQIAFKPTAPDAWHDGMSVNENAPTTRCTSVKALSGSDTKLYLHTVVADNPAEKKVEETRGTPVKNDDDFRSTYTEFSLSGICFTGDYPTDESTNPWTTNYAHNLSYKTADGTPSKPENSLLWPSNGKVRFFAFAPTLDDFKTKTGTDDGSLTLSEAGQEGSPTLTYTVPADVKKQVDLMTVQTTVTAATSPLVELKFGHALTAVQIICGKNMLAGKITEVSIEGVHGTGTQVIGADTWVPTSETTKYTIRDKISLSPASGEGVKDKIHVTEKTPITGTKTDNLTFMLLPQRLPEGAKMTIKFIVNDTDTELTLSASLAGQVWEPGKIVTYSVSQSSINISPKITFSKNPYIDENNKGDSIAYSGVWYDAKFTASAEIVQAGEDKGTIETFEADKVKFFYQFEDTETWAECEKDDKGLLKIEAQPHYLKITNQNETGSADKPTSLASGESANCYMVDEAGYYSLPLYYGNSMGKTVAEGHTNGLTYYPNHLNQKITSGEITGAEDAVLCWQDSPDLIDSVKLDAAKKNLIFHIRTHTLAQGNALLAVRNAAKQIIWSWHIWVTPHKEEFYSQRWTSKDGTNSYDLAAYNLGWCDHHETDEARNFKLKAVIDMSAYGGGASEEVEIGTFRQIELKGSDAGDNTYYQWGRKDPMLGGIYNSKTTKYTYTKHPDGGGTKTDKEEFTMENKQVFNQYNREEGHDYSFRKNPGDQIDLNDAASYGVTIGYTIQHPYMFITNSRSNKVDRAPFDYRNHWHIPYGTGTGYFESPYMNSEKHIMFNAWSAGAQNPDETKIKVTKSVYDPCPPGFKVPPIGAFTDINTTVYKGKIDYSNNTWEIKNSTGTIKFPLTGVRNYALRSNEWQSVSPIPTGNNKDDFYKMFYKTSMPAFQMLTFISSATIEQATNPTNAYQVKIFIIDRNNRQGNLSDNTNIKMYKNSSSNSYGLAVRPMFDDQSQTK